MKLKFLLYISIASFFTVSCYKDTVDSTITPDQNTIPTTISLDMPDHSVASTYALETPDENYIRIIDVLVFGSDNKFLYQSTGQAISDNAGAIDGNKKDFEVLLHKTNGAEQVKLVILANARYYIGSITEGEEKDEVLSRIVYSLPATNKWLADNSIKFDPIPMWGETGNVQITGNPISSVKMLRAMAKIDVGVNYVGNSATGISNFNLEEVYLYNINANGRVVPSPAFVNPITHNVTDASIPTVPAKHKGPVCYTIEKKGHYDQYGNYYPQPTYEIKNQIYVPESIAGLPGDEANSFCMVIGGSYSAPNLNNGGSTQGTMNYYRIDFIYDDSGVKKNIPILRNHRYRLNIKQIATSGYASPDEAFAGKIFNDMDGTSIVIDIDNTQTDENYMYFTDGIHVLKIPKDYSYNNSVTIKKDATSFSLDNIWTDHPDGWAAQTVDSTYYHGVRQEWTEVNTSEWVLPGSWSAPTNTSASINMNFTTPPTDKSKRSGYLKVYAGNISVIISISQRIASYFSSDIIDIPANYNGYNNPSFNFITDPSLYMEDNKHDYMWYDVANVPYMNSSDKVPPAGPQLYPPHRRSCAALEINGHRNWRMPALDEAKAMLEYIADTYTDPYMGNSSPIYLLYYGNYIWSSSMVTANSIASNNGYISALGYDDQEPYKYRISGDLYHKSTKLSWHMLPCIRSIDENLYVKTGTEHSFPGGAASTQRIIAYVKGDMGLKWSTTNTAQYNAMIANTQMTKLANVENGFEQWEIVLTSIANTATNERTASLVLATQGDEQSITIDLTQAGAYGFVIPKESTGFTYDMMVAEESMPVDLKWHVYANVPDNHNSPEVPPAGAQEVPARTGSCASFNGGGFNSWRMPTSEELMRMFDYMEETTSSRQEMIQKYKLPRYAGGSVMLCSSDSPNKSIAGKYAMVMDTPPYIYPHDKSQWYTTLISTRCVRNINEEFYVHPGNVRLNVFAAEYKFKVFSKQGLNMSLGTDANYNDIVSSITITPGVVENGYDTWDVVLNTKQASSATQTISELTFNSQTGGHSQKVKLIMPAYAIDVKLRDFEKGVYTLSLLLNDIPNTNTDDYFWYNAANTPHGYNTVNVPPLGIQVTDDTGLNGSRPNSCASLNFGGHENWRLPTLQEMRHIDGKLLQSDYNTSKYLYNYYFDLDMSDKFLYTTSTPGAWGNYYTYAQLSYYRYSGSSGGAYSHNFYGGEKIKSMTLLRQGEHVVRCVRDLVDDDFFSTPSMDVQLTFDELKLRASTAHGMQSTVTQGPNFANAIAGVTPTLVGPAPNGKQYWDIVINPKQIAAINKGQVTSFVVKSADGTKSKTINVTQLFGNIVPNDLSSLDSDILLASQDLRVNNTWFDVANVPDNYMLFTPHEFVLPLGQLSTPKANSCAALTDLGYTDWRMPTLEEQSAIIKTIGPAMIYRYFASSGQYLTSTNYWASNNSLKNYYRQYINTNNSDGYSTSWGDKAYSWSSDAYTRCVRSHYDMFNSRTYKVNAQAYSETIKMNVNTSHGMQPTVVPGTNYNDVVKNVSLTLKRTLNDGSEEWQIAIDTKTTSDGTEKDAYFTVKSADGSKTNTIIVHQRGEYVINSAGLMVAPYDLLQDMDWYVYANTPDNHNSFDIPPAGLQVAPPREHSCAALTVGGYTDWRLPTIDEAKNMHNHFSGLTGGKNKYYIMSNISTAESMVDNNTRFSYLNSAGTVSYGYKSSTHNSGYSVRCVRSYYNLFNSYTYTVEAPNSYAGSFKIIVQTSHGLQPSVTPGLNYDLVIGNISLVQKQTLPSGDQLWEITIDTKTAVDGIEKNAEFTVKSSDGSKTNIIKVHQRADYIIPSNNLMVATTDQPTNLTWYTYANTDDNHNSVDVPPLGNQQNPARANSCAALTFGGYTSWRMPTLDEINYMHTHFSGLPGGFVYYGFTQNWYYLSATAKASSPFNYAMCTYFRQGSYSNANQYKSSTGSNYTTRCVRTHNTLFNGQNIKGEADTYSKTIKIEVYTKHGLQTTAVPGSGYGNVIANIAFTHKSTHADGGQIWDIEVTTKAAVSDGVMDGQFSVKSFDGTKTQIITITRKTNFIIAAEGLMVSPADQPAGLTWYTYANTDDGYNSLLVPPLGNQQNPARANSCAALTAGGFIDWRMPTLTEATAMLAHYRTLTTNNIAMFNFMSSYYCSSTTYVSRIGEAYHAYAANTGSSYTYKTATNTGFSTRCVRPAGSLFEGASYGVESQTYTETVKLTVTTQYGLQSVVTPGTNYSSVVNGVTFTLLSTMPGGIQQWELAISTKAAASIAAVDAQFSVKSADGTKTDIITVRKKGDHIIPANNIMVAPEDQPAGLTWYTYANTDDGHNSLDVPPLGNQQNPARANSCAALTTEGYSDWRLPTLDEAKAMLAHYRALGGVQLFGLSMSYYWSANTYNFSSKNQAYYAYATSTSSSQTSKANTNTNYGARCVRTL